MVLTREAENISDLTNCARLPIFQHIIKREDTRDNGYFLAFGYHWLRSELQKGQSPLVLRSWFPQLGQKISFGCVASGFMEGVAAVSVIGAVVFGLSYMMGWEISCLPDF